MAVGVCVGITTVTPLFQTNFFPDLTQVNFFPATIDFVPTFAQAVPADGEAAEAKVGVSREAAKIAADAKLILLMRISPLYFGGGP